MLSKRVGSSVAEEQGSAAMSSKKGVLWAIVGEGVDGGGVNCKFDLDVDDDKLLSLDTELTDGVKDTSPENGLRPIRLRPSIGDCFCENLGFGIRKLLVVFCLGAGGG